MHTGLNLLAVLVPELFPAFSTARRLATQIEILPFYGPDRGRYLHLEHLVVTFRNLGVIEFFDDFWFFVHISLRI